MYYRDKLAKFPFQKECLGQCLGPAKNKGNVMANWILTQKSTVIPQCSICWLTLDEYSVSNEVDLAKRTAFNADVREKLGDSIKLPSTRLPKFVSQDWDSEPYDDDEVNKLLEHFEADLLDAAGRPILMHSLNDGLINSQVLLDYGDSAALARVVRQAVDSDGNVIGLWDSNPILNTLVYD